MSTNKTRYWCYINGKKEYVYGGTPGQAAASLGHRFNMNVSESWMREDIKKEVKPMYVYTFARKTSPYDRTSYEELLAKSEKQAWFYFNKSRGKQCFARIDSVRLASEEDLKRLKEGSLFDVTW